MVYRLRCFCNILTKTDKAPAWTLVANDNWATVKLKPFAGTQTAVTPEHFSIGYNFLRSQQAEILECRDAVQCNIEGVCLLCFVFFIGFHCLLHCFKYDAEYKDF